MKADTLLAFIGGAIAGAAAAILFAPESGSETRKKIVDSVETEYQALKKKYEEFKARYDTEGVAEAPESEA